MPERAQQCVRRSGGLRTRGGPVRRRIERPRDREHPCTVGVAGCVLREEERGASSEPIDVQRTRQRRDVARQRTRGLGVGLGGSTIHEVLREHDVVAGTKAIEALEPGPYPIRGRCLRAQEYERRDRGDGADHR